MQTTTYLFEVPNSEDRVINIIKQILKEFNIKNKAVLKDEKIDRCQKGVFFKKLCWFN